MDNGGCLLRTTICRLSFDTRDILLETWLETTDDTQEVYLGLNSRRYATITCQCSWGVGLGPPLAWVDDKGLLVGLPGFMITGPVMKILPRPDTGTTREIATFKTEIKESMIGLADLNFGKIRKATLLPGQLSNASIRIKELEATSLAQNLRTISKHEATIMIQ